MDTSSAGSSSAASDSDEEDALVENIKRNVTFGTPAEARAAVPAEPWTRAQKITVLEICRRMLKLTRETASRSDIAHYYNLALDLQHKMAENLDEKAAYDIMGTKVAIHTIWATFNAPAARNNTAPRARRRLMGPAAHE